MQRRHGLIALLVLVALALGYFGGRASAPTLDLGATAAHQQSDAAISTKGKGNTPNPKPNIAITHTDAHVHATVSAPLPPANAPLRQTIAELQARADAGDAVAASRLYRDLHHCSSAHRNRWLMAEAMKHQLPLTPSMPLDAVHLDEAYYDAVRARADSLCGDLNDDILDDLAPAMLQAAKLGDVDARNCYVHRGPFDDPHGLIDHPELLGAYRDNAAALIDAGLANGDWKMVDMLRYAYATGSQGSLHGLLGSDLVQYYRYARLYRLGADSPMAQVLDHDMEMMNAKRTLSAEQQAAGDAWAQAAFEQYFHGSSTAATPNGWDACAISDD